MAMRHLSLTSAPARRSYPLGMKVGLSHAFRYNIRGFHATSRRCFVDECLVQTHTLINGVHNLSELPWAASLPLTALLTGALVIFPFQCYSRKITTNLQRLAPSLEEAVRVAQVKATKANPGRTAREKESIIYADSRRAVRVFRRQHGLQTWKNYLIFMRLPIWLVVMETLRRMTGTEQGMLGLVWKSITRGHSPDLGTSDAAVIPVESSFVAEGMLWFPNLLLPDPSLLLPFMLSATLLTSAYYFPLVLRGISSDQILEHRIIVPFNQKAYGIGTRRLQQVLALAAGPATIQFPSAMTLYWISSGLCAIGSKQLLIWWMPMNNIAAPAKRTHPSAKQRFRGPTMQDLRAQNNKKKPKPKE